MMESAAFGKQAQVRLQLNNDRAVFLWMTWFPGDALGKDFQSIEDHQNGRQCGDSWLPINFSQREIGKAA